jgi:hypothetical protein
MEKTPKRIPIPKPHVQQFHGMVVALSESLKISKIPEIQQYITLLGEACDRYVVEEDAIKTRKERVSSRNFRRFIAIWKERYLQEYDSEYGRLDDGELGTVKRIIKEIDQHKLTVDDYLKWLFEEFFPNNTKLHPNVKLAGSKNFIRQFVAEHVDTSKQRKKREMANIEFTDLSNRIKKMASDPETKELAKKAYEEAKRFKNGDIIISELRKTVEGLERQAKRKAKRGN